MASDGWRHYDVGNVRYFVPFNGTFRQHDLPLDEGERQLLILALAVLSLESPGFDYALNEIARKMDNVVDGRAVMYDGFRKTREKK